ncbi:MAG: Rieske (2Fe-2S) protein [Gammaproteobacteria bacterium]|nr:Rieske (2Fe-2S) protein [Gammaproteobacteria bacterium]
MNGDSPALHPFPEGWYFVANRADLGNGNLIHKTWLGEEIVAWCDEQGRVCVADAVCPHLGSSLAPEVGSRVCEGRLICPFHGFAYDTTGRCVATPYALPPKSARLNVYATREIEGMVFGWWGIRGRSPQWELPESPQLGSARGHPSHEGSPQLGSARGHPAHEKSRWTGLRFHTLRFRGHPQETTENSVDMAHLRYVHGYESVSREGDITIDGAYLRSAFKFKTRVGAGGLLNTAFDVSAVAHIFGLGYSQVDFQEHSTGYRSRLWILSTPIDGTSVAMTIGSQVGGMERPKGVGFGLRLLPLSVRLNLRHLRCSESH